MATENGTQIALIVEDNPDVREIYVAELQRMGWESVTALLDEDIRAAVLEYDFDVAILDSHFPGIPLEKLRALIGKTPYVIVSLDDSISGDNVIQKPFLLGDLRRLIETVAEKELLCFAEGDIVKSRAHPEQAPGIVIAVEEERVYVRFGGATAGESKPLWCHRSGLIKLGRPRSQ